MIMWGGVYIAIHKKDIKSTCSIWESYTLHLNFTNTENTQKLDAALKHLYKTLYLLELPSKN